MSMGCDASEGKNRGESGYKYRKLENTKTAEVGGNDEGSAYWELKAFTTSLRHRQQIMMYLKKCSTFPE